MVELGIRLASLLIPERPYYQHAATPCELVDCERDSNSDSFAIESDPGFLRSDSSVRESGRGGSSQVIALVGELGAGKTTLAKGLIFGLTGTSIDSVTSPTFQYLCLYEGNGRVVAHFDLWRLSGADDFFSLGFDDFLLSNIALIEWPDRIASILPPNTLFITSSVVEGGRKVIVGDQHGTAQ